MNYLSRESIVTGRQYPITGVDGQPPRNLANFSGDVCLTVIRNEAAVHMVGAGCQAVGSAVRFYQKDPGSAGKDIRVWTISQDADGTFVAVPVAAF